MARGDGSVRGNRGERKGGKPGAGYFVDPAKVTSFRIPKPLEPEVDPHSTPAKSSMLEDATLLEKVQNPIVFKGGTRIGSIRTTGDIHNTPPVVNAGEHKNAGRVDRNKSA